MTKMELFKFLALLAISFELAIADDLPASRQCSDFKRCGACLAKSSSGCVWYVGPDSTGSCIESDQCDTDAHSDGECFEGKDGDRKYNKFICKGTCQTQTELGCASCLAFDAGGRKKSNISDCAWYVTPGGEPQCIARQRCRQKGFRSGKCIRGKLDQDNTEKCAAEPIDRCEARSSCGRCLASQFCSWYVEGETSKCIHNERCDDSEFENGTCTAGAITFDTEKTCEAIEGGTLSKPIESLPEIRDPGEDEVGFEKCNDFGGLCTDCLNNGCSWVNQSKECVDSCLDAPADVGCAGLRDTYKPLPVTKAPVDLTEPGDRALLQFEDIASQMCYDFKLEDRNLSLCKRVGTGGCRRCVNTKLFTAPNVRYLIPPTCKWFPDTETCYPFSSGLMGEGTDQCDDDIVVGPYEPLPPPGTTWPELVGQSYSAAHDYLTGTYGPQLRVVKILEGSIVTDDYVVTRVRIFVNKDDIVAAVPEIG